MQNDFHDAIRIGIGKRTLLKVPVGDIAAGNLNAGRLFIRNHNCAVLNK